jgi:peptidoglycan/xylan/chitin deacetylase (PgdA/CDA1 family)
MGVNLKDGTAAQRVGGSSATSGNLRLNYAPGGGVDMSGWQTFDVDVYIESPSADRTSVPLNLAFTNDSGFANNFSLAAANGGSIVQLVRGWNTLRFGRQDFGVAAGAPSWSSPFSIVRFNLDLVSGQVITAAFSNLRKGAHSRTQICFVFDDQGESVYSKAFAEMSAYGFPGSVAVIGSYLGGSGVQGGYVRCTVSQLREMIAAGWDCVNHSYLHLQNVWQNATSAQSRDEILKGQQALVDNGLSTNNSHLIYCSPFGEWSDSYLAGAQQAGCTHFRAGINFGITAAEMLQSDTLDAAFRPVPTIVPINTSTLATMKTIVDRAIGAGRHIIITMHHITDSPASSIEWSTSNFQALIRHIWSRSAACDVVNYQTWLSRVTRPTE